MPRAPAPSRRFESDRSDRDIGGPTSGEESGDATGGATGTKPTGIDPHDDENDQA